MSEAAHESKASRATQRGAAALARTAIAGALLASVPFIPQAREALGVGPDTTWAAFGASALCTTVATLAYHRLGDRSLGYRLSALVEATTYAVLPLFLVYASGRGESIFWLTYVAYAAINGRATEHRRVLLVLIAAPPVLLALAFLIVRGDVAAAAFSILAGVGGTSIFLVGMRTSLRLAEAIAERERLREELVQHRIHEERDRIARELHDGVGADLSALAWRAQRVRTGISDQQVSSEMGALIERATQGIDELRSVVWAMRAPARTWGELVAYVRHRAEEQCAGRVELDVRVSDEESERSVPGEVGLHVIRIVQEAVRNAVRHGDPSRVALALDAGPPVTIVVEDDGSGIPAEALAHSEGGLHNLRRRAEAMGGALHVEAGSEGSRLEVRLPELV